jgi:hypothetical protein
MLRDAPLIPPELTDAQSRANSLVVELENLLDEREHLNDQIENLLTDIRDMGYSPDAFTRDRKQRVIFFPLLIPMEETLQVDYSGQCSCCECQDGDNPQGLFRGMTVFKLGNATIYANHLQRELQHRMVVL